MVILPNEHALTFILGGKSYFTIKNTVSGRFIHYNINKAKDGSCWFVNCKNSSSMESGGDKDNGWQYLGWLKNNELRITGKSKFKYNSNEFQGIDRVLFWLRNNNMPSNVLIYRHIWCGVCGAKLVDEASVIDGIGPTCYKRVHGHSRSKSKAAMEERRNSGK